MRRTILLLALLTVSTGAAWRRGDAYMLHTGKSNVSMMSASVDDIVSLQRRFGSGPYLWVRLGGREWMIRDEGLLREAEEMWAPIRALEPEQHQLGEEESRLDKRMDAISDRRAKAEPGEMARLRERYAVVSRRVRELDQRSEAMEKVVEAKLRDLVDDAIRDGRAKELR